MVWYFIVIPIIIGIILKLVVPYIKKNYIDNTMICGVCREKYNKKFRGCPNCGVENE
ncbi:MAG: hypothetical protein OEM28_13420 [Nitrosopumilus sp.]|nr:hypothetical protein [Nitrosopumilus sp.]MDH3488806.1 hypothetical protein [Nitrosopumilus sp.]